RGHRFIKVHFYGGDLLFWGKDHAINYNRTLDELPAFYQAIIEEYQITDIVLFNDCRPVHRPAIELAEQLGLDLFVMEEGYLRPHWINLEWGGMNGYSYLSTEADWYRQQAAKLPDTPPQEPVGGAQPLRTRHDLLNTAAIYLYFYKFFRYRTHRPYPILIEYLFWAKRLAALKYRKKQAQQKVEWLKQNKLPYFLFPLQLDTDVQIRLHFAQGGMKNCINKVMQSFSVHAPATSLLLIKNHPLDNGMINYRRLIAETASQLSISERVIFIDGGDLEQIIKHSQGVVLINSTVGFTTLELMKPLITLGKAIYDLPGLTFQGKLDTFWSNPPDVDETLWQDVRKVIMHHTMANGNFFTDRGIELAIQNVIERLEIKGCPYGDLPPAPRKAVEPPNRLSP
ncbi:MAG: capsular biosynthesis protein, partial [Gammaproteobacteria bacterium]